MVCQCVVIAAQAETVRIPGTRVSLDRPPGFELAQQFPGFQRTDARASIIVMEMSAPYDEMRDAMSTEGLEERGVMVESMDAVSVADRDGLLIGATQTAQGAVVKKWMALFGDHKTTVMVVAQMPLVHADQLSVPMRAAVVSARWAPESDVGMFEGLGFSVEPTAKLQITDRMANMLVLTKPGHEGIVPPWDPRLVVGPSLGDNRIDDVEAFSRWQLTQNTTVSDVQTQSGRPVYVHGMFGYELVASATHIRSGVPLLVYQTVLLDKNGFFLLLGHVGSAQADEYLAEFRAVADTLTLVD